MVVSLKLQSELFVVNPQVSVPAAHNCFRHDFLHFLRQYTDIHLVGAIVRKSIEANAIVEMTEKNDIVLERNIGPASAPPAAKTSASETPGSTAPTET